jgi:hypothetical protein
MTKSSLFASVGGLAVVLLASSSALAATGYVSGTLRFWQKQGNYCPTGRDCTGSNYLQSAFDTAQPMRELQVQVVNATTTSTVYGQGVTDVNGNYLIQWTTPSTPPAAKILWKFRHKDTRFEVRSASSGGIYFGTSSNITLTSGTTQGAPQVLPTFTTGSSGSPNHIANLYDGAHRQWYFALSFSGLMTSLFTTVQVLAFDNDPCTSSCADGATKTITIDSTGSALSPQARIMHEMGHIANYLSKPFKATNAYGHPSTSCVAPNCVWSLNTQEWASAAFEEGLATFVGDVAMYWLFAPQPTTCLSTLSCSLSFFHVENSSGSSCGTGESRFPINVDRYLWDIYDSIDDPAFVDTTSINYWQFFVVVNNYPTGTSNNQNNEPWNSTLTTVDDFDGRSSADFQFRLNSVYSIDSSVLRTNNCGSL